MPMCFCICAYRNLRLPSAFLQACNEAGEACPRVNILANETPIMFPMPCVAAG